MYTGIWIIRSLYQTKLKTKTAQGWLPAGFGFSTLPLIIEEACKHCYCVLPWWRRCGQGDAWRAWPWVWCVHTVGCLSERWPPCTGRCRRAQPEGWGGARLSSLWTYLMGRKGLKVRFQMFCYCFWDTAHTYKNVQLWRELFVPQGNSPHDKHTVNAVYLKHIHCSAASVETLFGLIQKVLFLIQTASQSNKSSTIMMSHYGFCIPKLDQTILTVRLLWEPYLNWNKTFCWQNSTSLWVKTMLQCQTLHFEFNNFDLGKWLFRFILKTICKQNVKSF